MPTAMDERTEQLLAKLAALVELSEAAREQKERKQKPTKRSRTPKLAIPTAKRRKPHDLASLLATLPPGRRRVAEALVMGGDAPTYPEVAKALGLHLGTVHAHLRRVRLLHPQVWEALMAERHWQLARRHADAVARSNEHSRRWHRRQTNRRYYDRYGSWPWERRRW